MDKTLHFGCMAGTAASLALLAGCTFIQYMGFPDVNFDQSTPSQHSDRIQLVRGRSGDGTEALRMSVQASSQDIQGESARVWVQCLDGTLEVLLVTERPLQSRERCMRLDATVTAPAGRTLVTRACVSHYSPKVLTVEKPLAFLDFAGDATAMQLVLGSDEDTPATLELEPVLDRDFLGELLQLCPADWQPERRDEAESAPAEPAEPAAPAGRVIDPSKPPAPFPSQQQAAPASQSAAHGGASAAAPAKKARASGSRVQEQGSQDSQSTPDRDIEARLRSIEETAKAAAEL